MVTVKVEIHRGSQRRGRENPPGRLGGKAWGLAKFWKADLGNVKRGDVPAKVSGKINRLINCSLTCRYHSSVRKNSLFSLGIPERQPGERRVYFLGK